MSLASHLEQARRLQAAGAAGVDVDLAPRELVEGILHYVLAIKASPPTYKRIVANLDDLLWGAWKVATDGATEAAIRRFGSSQAALWGAVADGKELARDLGNRLAANGTWRDELAKPVGAYGAAAFLLGFGEVGRETGWSVDFSLADQDVVHGLNRAGLFWIGNHYGDVATDRTLIDTIRKVNLEGVGREEGGERLRAALGGHFAKSRSYWTLLAGTIATRARSFGALSGMITAGATRYRYTNPDDERTSDVCRELNGAEFTVKAAVELRDRLHAEADTPEKWKTIAPWPKNVEAVRDAAGQRLGEAALLAQGIAWPPLHGYCRSTIDVSAWAPITDLMPDPVGNVAPPAVKPPPKPRAPRAPRTPKPPPAAARGWREVKAEYDAAVADLRRRGLPTDRYGCSVGLRDAIFQHVDPIRRARNTTAPIGLEFIWGKSALARDAEGPWRAFALAAAALRQPGAWHNPALAQRLEEELEAMALVTRLHRDIEQHAPIKVREALRRKLTLALLPTRPRGETPERWAAIQDGAVHAMRVFPLDALRVLAADGEAAVHEAGFARAHAWPGSAISGGHIRQDLTTMIARRVDPVTGISKWEAEPGRGTATFAHEFGHRFDGVNSNEGTNGIKWVYRADFPRGEAAWRDSIYATFEQQKARDRSGATYTIPLPHESQARNRFQWAGTWATAYEARIYHGGMGQPTDLELASSSPVGGDGGAGPVEFISMATQYVQEAQDALRRATKNTGDSAAGALFILKNTTLAKASRLYGAGYRDGLEGLLGGGERVVRELVEERGLQVTTVANVYTWAMLVSRQFGLPLARLIGEDGLLVDYLPAPATEAVIQGIEGRMPALDADDADVDRELRRTRFMLEAAHPQPAKVPPPP